MAFHDVEFPLRLAFGASGGPARAVDISTLANGREVRNTAQSRSRRRYNALTGVKSIEDARILADFFEARSGRLNGFRFRDPIDFCSGDHEPSAVDQVLATGDGTQTRFQLVKRYGEVVRPITRPVNSSVMVAVNGAIISAQIHPLGIVEIDAPPVGAVVSAGFIFDVPVRFDVEGLVLSLDRHGAVNVADVPLIELFDHA